MISAEIKEVRVTPQCFSVVYSDGIGFDFIDIDDARKWAESLVCEDVARAMALLKCLPEKGSSVMDAKSALSVRAEIDIRSGS